MPAHIFTGTSVRCTTLPTFTIVLLIFVIWGLQYGNDHLPQAHLAEIRQALASSYRLEGEITLLPLLVMLGMSMKRYAAEVSMTCSILLAVLIAVVYQGRDGADVINALWLNVPGNTGIASVDELLGRGGLYSMAWTLLLSIMALALGGILHRAGFLQELLMRLITPIRRTGTLIAATIASGLAGNLVMGEAYISIILSCQVFKPVFQEKNLDLSVLSRSVEEGSTLTTGLIPWTTAGIFYAATLGVPVLDYAPYALLNVLNPVISISMAVLGIGLLQSKSR
ncbi:Na+/H+ antiporter NhaC family protein [Nitrosomonas sp.]|uniref:Na+/H+ antiporter NhaC family protein n=1 Tax=Nitrosomonas sp. TaxID=42353 RepID=UPI0025CF1C1A|nr:Na+/H+ antiporter NhaC family protein [Nitrosomonas sp.]